MDPPFHHCVGGRTLLVLPQGFVPEAATSHGALPSLFRFLEAMREAICIHIGQGGAYHRCELSIRGQVWVLPVVKV